MQGRAAPLAYCTQRSYCHWWEGEADHLPVPAKISLKLLNKLSNSVIPLIFSACTVFAICILPMSPDGTVASYFLLLGIALHQNH